MDLQQLRAAAQGYQGMIKKELSGSQPINRPESFGRKKRLVKHLNGKSDWFKKKPKDEQFHTGYRSKGRPTRGPKPVKAGAPESVLFIPHTLDSLLKKEMMEVDSFVMRFQRTGSVKVVETLGQKLNEGLVNPAPWGKQHCGRKDCPPAPPSLVAARVET